jgi:uncharacterized membrane protein
MVSPTIYGFWFFWLSFGILWPLHCLSYYLRLLVILWYLVAIALSLLLFTASGSSGYPLVSCGHGIVSPTIYDFWLSFGILWPLHCLSYYLRLLVLLVILWYLVAITLSLLLFTTSGYPLVSCGHGIVSPTIYGIWLVGETMQ